MTGFSVTQFEDYDYLLIQIVFLKPSFRYLCTFAQYPKAPKV